MALHTDVICQIYSNLASENRIALSLTSKTYSHSYWEWLQLNWNSDMKVTVSQFAYLFQSISRLILATG